MASLALESVFSKQGFGERGWSCPCLGSTSGQVGNNFSFQPSVAFSQHCGAFFHLFDVFFHLYGVFFPLSGVFFPVTLLLWGPFPVLFSSLLNFFSLFSLFFWAFPSYFCLLCHHPHWFFGVFFPFLIIFTPFFAISSILSVWFSLQLCSGEFLTLCPCWRDFTAKISQGSFHTSNSRWT